MGGTLYAGPWSGEFGWEICSWSPCIRKMAQTFDRVIVETVPGSEYLYEFADEIVTNPRQPNYDMCKGQSKNEPKKPEKPFTAFSPMDHWRKGGKKEFQAIKRANRVISSIPPKEWRVLGTEKPHYVADIMCAFRGPKTFKKRSFPEKEWEHKKCDELVARFKDAGFTVACYGGRDNYVPPGTLDYRQQPLDELAGALSQAKLAIGPSSGTIHLASQCGTPHVTWYGRPNDSMDRYMFYWNPHKTCVTFINTPKPSAETAFSVSLERMEAGTPAQHYVNE